MTCGRKKETYNIFSLNSPKFYSFITTQ